MARINSRKTGITLSYVSTIANTVIGLFMSVYYVRSVGKSEYGVYQSMASFLSYLTLLEFGLGSVMTRNISMCDKNSREDIDKNVSTIWNTSIGLSIAILSIATVFYLFIDKIYANSFNDSQIVSGKMIFMFMAIRMVFSFVSQGLKGAILGFERYGVTQLASLVHLIVRTMLAIAVLAVFHDMVMMTALDLASQIAVTLFLFFYCKHNLKLRFSVRFFSKQIFIASFPLAFALFLQTIVNTANNNVDKFVISVLLNPESVAVYSVAMYIYTTYSVLMTVPISQYMPQVAKDIKSGKSGMALTETMVSPCRLATVIGGAIMFGFISVGRSFIEVFYGNDYMEAWLIAVVIMVPMYIHMTDSILVNVLDVMQKRMASSLCQLGTTISNIILTVILVKCWGMIGGALATCVCTLLGQVLVLNIYYAKKINIRILWLYKESYKGILLCFVLATIAALPVTFFISNSVVSLILGGVIFVAVSACTLMLFGLNAAEKKEITHMLHRFLPGRR